MKRFVFAGLSCLLLAGCLETRQNSAIMSSAYPSAAAPALVQVPRGTGLYEPAVDMTYVNLDRWQRDTQACKLSSSRQSVGMRDEATRQIAEQVAGNADIIRVDVRGSAGALAYENRMRACMAGRGYLVLN